MSHLSQFKAALAKKGVDAAIVSDKLNQRYLSMFDFDDGLVLVTKGESYLITDFRYVEAARAAVDQSEFEIVTPDNGAGIAMCGFLEENGCMDGHTVSIYDFEFEYVK